ncbi:unnamed protein product [Nippostrongylus brasiliensis]|uniref:Reverse transcriptase domain-containing protein n=1 Tax=Nippostrongylus brasiliensis TaxID=27835 RepID=A0A0N4YBB9_NIPBR|nr:unnamed protein product [Nippostrongylus brasiliensis]
MKKTSTNLKPKHGGAYYEPWMDYKEDSTASSRASNRRTTSTTRRNSSPKKTSETKPSSSEKTNVKGRSGSVQSIRSIPRTLPPPYSPPRDYTKDKDTGFEPIRDTVLLENYAKKPTVLLPSWGREPSLIAKIEVEFKAFYSWTINGREDDMTREHIEKLLFPDL